MARIISKPRSNGPRTAEIHEFNSDLLELLNRLQGSFKTAETHRPLRIQSTIHRVSWSAYKSFLRAIDRKGLRHSYRDGTLELMAPRTFWRETRKSLVRRFAQHLSSELCVELTSLGRIPITSPSRGIGLEPDEAFAVATGSGKRVKPNLVIEVADGGPEARKVAVEEHSVSRMRLLRELGIAEVWFVRGTTVTIFTNERQCRWQRSVASRFFSCVTSALLSKHLARSRRSGENDAIRGLLYDVSHDSR